MILDTLYVSVIVLCVIFESHGSLFDNGRPSGIMDGNSDKHFCMDKTSVRTYDVREVYGVKPQDFERIVKFAALKRLQ